MGYTTDFWGEMKFNKPLEPSLVNYVNKLSDTRRMKRDNDLIKKVFPNWQELCYNGELGVNGEFFVGGKGWAGQEHDESIIDYNEPSYTQPGLWCQWVISEDGTSLGWNGGEKFYDYVEWLQYLYDKFFKPNGYELSGVIDFQGKDYEDRGKLDFKEGKVRCRYANITFEEDY